jgi:hypothetical protein
MTDKKKPHKKRTVWLYFNGRKKQKMPPGYQPRDSEATVEEIKVKPAKKSQATENSIEKKQ